MENINFSPLTQSMLYWSAKLSVKNCTKCKQDFPATFDFFYHHPSGRFGLTPRCKSCTNEDNKKSHAARLAREPEKVRAQQTARTMRNYYKDLEKSRRKHREFQAKLRSDPVKAERIKYRKRASNAGLTPEDWSMLFEKQGRVCAICKSDHCGTKAGWNTDHCHATGAVRFILCAHCNRGLGAFKDNPDLMRRAADVLEAFYQCQPDRPVTAIMEAAR